MKEIRARESVESAAEARKYSNLREVGHGSFGKAWLVQDGSGRQFIMKTIDMSQMGDKQKREAINEVRVLSSLKHPYIVSYRESFIDRGVLCIIMDYAEAGDLHKRLVAQKRSGSPFEEQQILRWFTQVTLALKYMHEKHILHRDLKSQNMFMTCSGRLKLGDFGISKALESTCAFANTTIGTPYYLSPEICRNQPYSWSSDIWALGCFLFELCVLRVPFDAANIKQLVDRITNSPTPSIPSHFSVELQVLAEELLTKDHHRRPSAAEILQKPIVQAEIRRMLREEQHKKKSSSPDSATPASDRPRDFGTPPKISNSDPSADLTPPPCGEKVTKATSLVVSGEKKGHAPAAVAGHRRGKSQQANYVPIFAPKPAAIFRR